jgi:hypothetical protein
MKTPHPLCDHAEEVGADSEKVESFSFEFLVDPSNLLPNIPRSSMSLRMEAQRINQQ